MDQSSYHPAQNYGAPEYPDIHQNYVSFSQLSAVEGIADSFGRDMSILINKDITPVMAITRIVNHL
jgi:hypothetical protein